MDDKTGAEALKPPVHEQKSHLSSANEPNKPNPVAPRIILLPDNVDPRTALEQLARWESGEQEGVNERLVSQEQRYLENFPEKGRDALKKRYEQVDAKQINDDIQAVVIKPILEKRRLGMALGGWEIRLLMDNRNNGQVEVELQQELKALVLTGEEKKRLSLWQEQMAKPPDKEHLQIIRQALESQVRLLFLNKDGGIYNPDKYHSVAKQTEESIDLFLKAQTEGSIPKDIIGQEMTAFFERNIQALALQDRAASENLLGDHGVRHIVDHNIRVSMLLADQLEAQGIEVKAIDRLLSHQAHIHHDFGYGMSIVRGAINAEGPKGQDAGHNVLAASYARHEYLNDPVWRKIFSEQDFALMHTMMLYHDKDENGKASIKFYTKEESVLNSKDVVRKTHLESIMRTADNTHAFEDKLPELLYRIPESVKMLRLMRTAGELNDAGSISRIKTNLLSIIDKHTELSNDDKIALGKAVSSLNPESYRFTVDRICGNKPEYSIENGKLHLTVNVLEIHREVVGLFDRDSYSQLVKMIRDVYDYTLEKGEMPKKIVSREGHILEKKEGGGKNDYQKMLEAAVVGDEQFQNFLIADNRLREMQRAVDHFRQRVQEGTSSYNSDELAKAGETLREKRQKILNEALLFS